jgi:hypothetical protein
VDVVGVERDRVESVEVVAERLGPERLTLQFFVAGDLGVDLDEPGPW